MNLASVVFIVAGILCLFPFVSAAWALLGGMLIALSIGNPYLNRTRGWTSTLLQYSVMGLGASMDLGVVLKVGAQGIGYTICGIALTLVLGYTLGRLLKIHEDTSLLVSSGTAICGGSAIAAVAATIEAKPAEISISLATVFFLNALALFIFPWIGHALDLTQNQFGLWSALAIHDTSSVVGSALQFGSESLKIATTIKLARALWIIPLAVLIGVYRRRSNGQSSTTSKPKYPWFILGFLGVAALVTFFPALKPLGEQVTAISKRGLVITLFLIGSGLTRATFKSVGFRPFVQGLILWIVVASSTLGAIFYGWIS